MCGVVVVEEVCPASSLSLFYLMTTFLVVGCRLLDLLRGGGCACYNIIVAMFTRYNVDVLVTSPTVPYQAELDTGELVLIETPDEFVQSRGVKTYLEPIVTAQLVMPATCVCLTCWCVTMRFVLDYVVVSVCDIRGRVEVALDVLGVRGVNSRAACSWGQVLGCRDNVAGGEAR